MSRRLMTLSWLFVLVVAGILGNLTAQKLHAQGAGYYCPVLNNSSCPLCMEMDFSSGTTWCHNLQGSFKVCDSGEGNCNNTNNYGCAGVQNSGMDCSGMDSQATCGANFDACP